MKKLTSLVPKILFLLLLTLSLGASFNKTEAASTWHKYPGNPLTFDSDITALDPYILSENGSYKMFYVGNEGYGWKIYNANSTNGLSWERNPEFNIKANSTDSWESGTENASAMYNNFLNIYQMWYISTNTSHWNVGLDRFRLRYATSSDGVNWDRLDGWTSTINSDAWADSNAWDKGGIARGISVLFKDGTYHLWYAGTNDSNLTQYPFWRIGYATSTDGIHWTKQNNGNPVIIPTKSWEINNVAYPNVIYENGKYKMWYAASYGDMGTQIVYATSTDGINWDKPDSENPVLTTSPSGFDSGNIISPFVMRDGKVYKMWYSGFGNTGYGYSWKIGYATKSADLILDVPNLKQTDEPWQGNIYDSADKWNPANSTINRWGCALTSAAMILRYHGINLLPGGTILDPGSLNTWLNNQEDGYVGDGYINWLAVSRLSRLARDTNNITDFEALEYQRISGRHDTDLTNDLNNSRPDILQEPGHFIVAKGIGEGTFYINDPYYNRTDLNSYDNNYLSLGRYIPSNTNLSYIMLATNPEIQ
ncbi:MAG: C39 family peptidase, partial [Actinobacteria bacterium]|nr:C39 family peptidase [Actinomycetota bacterium]